MKDCSKNKARRVRLGLYCERSGRSRFYFTARGEPLEQRELLLGPAMGVWERYRGTGRGLSKTIEVHRNQLCRLKLEWKRWAQLTKGPHSPKDRVITWQLMGWGECRMGRSQDILKP